MELNHQGFPRARQPDSKMCWLDVEASGHGMTLLDGGLRERVMAAVIGEGMSCHAAATRFGVAASSAITWVQRVCDTGNAALDRMGGRRTRILSGPHRDWLLERGATDFTLRGSVAELAARGASRSITFRSGASSAPRG